MKKSARFLSALVLLAPIHAWSFSVTDSLTPDNVNYFVGQCAEAFIKLKQTTQAIQDSFYWGTGTSNYIAYSCFPSQHHTPRLERFFKHNFMGIVNKTALKLTNQRGTFTPRVKGQFEKTSDYQAAIKKDQEAFNKANIGGQLDLPTFAMVWSSMAGPLRIVTDLGKNQPKYDPDKEQLTIYLWSPENRSVLPPISFYLSIADAQRLCTDDSACKMRELLPSLSIGVSGSSIILKTLTLALSQSYIGDDKDFISSLNLKDIPVGMELKYRFGQEASAFFDKAAYK